MAEAQTLKSLFGDIFEDNKGDIQYHPFEPREFTPSVDPRYVFELADVRVLLMWSSQRTAYARNLMITGPSGSGKTQLVFQWAARTGRELFRYSCNERTDFSELLGTMIITDTGATAFQDGPLTLAMKRGGIFLLDEVNAARPGALIGLNGVLDGSESLMVPGSGELVRRHPDFRVAVSGNSMNRDDTASSFRGTQTMNAAFLDRFMAIEKTYLPQLVEAKALQTYLGDSLAAMGHGDEKVIPQGFVVKLVEFANEVREQFVKGEVEATISTRGLFAMNEIVAMQWPHLCRTGAEGVLQCAELAWFNKMAPSTRLGLRKAFEARSIGKELLQLKAQTSPTSASSSTGARKTRKARMFVNRDRLNTGDAAFWGYFVDGNDQAKDEFFNGMLTGVKTGLRFTGVRSGATYFSTDQEVKAKVRKGYFFVAEADLDVTMLQQTYDGLVQELSIRSNSDLPVHEMAWKELLQNQLVLATAFPLPA